MNVEYSFNGTYHKAKIVDEQGGHAYYPYVFYDISKTNLEERVKERLEELK